MNYSQEGLPVVTRQQAIHLKNLGFNLPCMNFYVALSQTYYEAKLDGKCSVMLQDFNDEVLQPGRISAPTVQVVIRWLYDQFKIDFYPVVCRSARKVQGVSYDWSYDTATIHYRHSESRDKATELGLDCILQHLLRVSCNMESFKKDFAIYEPYRQVG